MNAITLSYAAQVVLISGAVFILFWLLYRKSNNLFLNRVYLLSSFVLPWVLPLIKVDIKLPQAVGPDPNPLLPVVLSDMLEQESVINSVDNSFFTVSFFAEHLISLLAMAGIAVMTFSIVKQIAGIQRIKAEAKRQLFDGKIIWISGRINQPFSFFKCIFIPQAVSCSHEEMSMIVRHEYTHVQQNHWMDLLLANAVLAIGWWNPFFHLLKKQLIQNHEFVADQSVVRLHDPSQYARLLLSRVFNTQYIAFAHAIFNSSVKTRIMFLYQKNSTKYLGKYFIVAPFIALLFCSVCMSFSPATILAPAKTLKIVVDAGHGGMDGGASTDGLYEKNITVTIANLIKAKSEGSNVEVILTRERDELPIAGNINESLKHRVEILNRENADAMISIHVGATKKSKATHGIEAYITRNSNDLTEKSRKFASVILSGLKNGPLSVNTEIKQNTAQSIYVLDKNPKPAVILEVGYLSNANDVAILKSHSNIEKIAAQIFAGLQAYAGSMNN